jgi:hypothetical protein
MLGSEGPAAYGEDHAARCRGRHRGPERTPAARGAAAAPGGPGGAGVGVRRRDAAAQPDPARALRLPAADRQHPAVVHRLEHLEPAPRPSSGWPTTSSGSPPRTTPRIIVRNTVIFTVCHGVPARWCWAWRSRSCSTRSCGPQPRAVASSSRPSSSRAPRSGWPSSSSSTRSFGLIRDLLARVGVADPRLLPAAGLGVVHGHATYIWKNLGYSFVIYLAALQGRRDRPRRGGRDRRRQPWTHFRKVLLPQLRPTTFFLSITVLLNSVQVFDIIYADDPRWPRRDRHDHAGLPGLPGDLRQHPGPATAPRSRPIMFLILLVTITVVQVRIMDRGQQA